MTLLLLNQILSCGSLDEKNLEVHLRHQISTSPFGIRGDGLSSVVNQSSDSRGQNSGLLGVLATEAISSEILKAGSSGEVEEGLGGVGLGETVTIDDSVEDGGENCRVVGESLLETSMEEDLNRRRPQWKTTSKEDDLTGRLPHRKTTSQENTSYRKTPNRRTTSQKDNFTGRRRHNRKTS